MIPILIDGSQESIRRLEELLLRGRLEDEQALAVVKEIIEDVRHNGDEAVAEYTRRLDAPAFSADHLRVDETDYERAYMVDDDEFLKSIRLAVERVRRYHERQMRNSWFMTEEDGVILGQIVQPLQRVGIHIPSVSQTLVSSLIMNVIPAKVAGVKEVVCCIPPMRNGNINPYMLITARECGVDEIYRVGGAQAIAAMAYGTETIEPVDKIFGPGNIYVQLAKREVFGIVDIDMIAGPSEILVVADEDANPSFIAADLLSQAEHNDDSSSVLVTDSLELARAVKKEIEKQIERIARSKVAELSLQNYGAIFVVETLERAFEIAAEIAPEHIELHVKDPFKWIGKVKNAGAIMVGQYSPESVGDYMAGPNHTLPTGGTARFYSPLSVDDFMRRSSLIQFTESALKRVVSAIVKIAEVEGLDAHAKSATIRIP